MKNFFLPFFFLVTSLLFCQQTEYVDFKNAMADIVFKDLTKKEIRGTVSYRFEILKNVDSIFMDALKMEFNNVLLDGEKIAFSNDGKKLWLKHSFLKGKNYSVSFSYQARPKKAMYFMGWEPSTGTGQIWTQGQGKYTSNWLPSIDDMNEKIEFDLSITFDSTYEVIANGNLTAKQWNGSTATWFYDMQQPMPSYLVALAIGEYNKKVEYSKRGVPLEMYYYPWDSAKVEPTYRYTKQMFDFLEEEIAVPYPWQNYKMVPVKDFLYAGMENTTLNIYADTFVVDSIAFVDKNFVNINAHELAHQWFGNLVTATSGTHHWLQEGFATYYALLAEKEIFGGDYYYWRLYEYAQELLEQARAGQSTTLLDPKSSSTTFYKKGAWVLHLLRKRVGDEAFKTAVRNYLEKHQFKNVETDDFINEVEEASGDDLSDFKEAYLLSKDDSFLKKEKCLIKNKLTNVDLGENPLRCRSSEDTGKFKTNQNSIRLKYLSDSISSETKVGIFKELLNDSIFDRTVLFETVFDSKDIKLRQVAAQTLTEIPSGLKTDYESLLDDKSYVTIETALFNLWRNFPGDRQVYLDKTKGIQGFKDKNLRVLWLTLALITEGYEPQYKKQYFEELTDYTSSKYGFEIRQNAFRYLYQIQACNHICKENLKQAATHHNWRFKKFAKALLEEVQ